MLPFSFIDVCLVHKFSSGKFIKTYQVDRRFTRAKKVVTTTEGLIAIQMADAFLYFRNASLDVLVQESEVPNGLKDFTLFTNQVTKELYLVFFLPTVTGLHVTAIKVTLASNIADLEQVNEAEPVRETEKVHEKLNELRFLLEKREGFIHKIRNATADVLRTDKPAHIKSIVNMQQPFYLGSGTIKELHLNTVDLTATPSELLQNVAWIVNQTNQLSDLVAPKSRKKRTTDTSTPLPSHKSKKKIVVKNLHYEGPQFKGKHFFPFIYFIFALYTLFFC